MCLVASTAAASIPDSNGVFHGCYNLFTGSARIIDGTNCSVLEKAVTWQQKGIAGPMGPQGASGQSVTGASLNVDDPHCPAGGVALTLAGSTTYVCNGLPGPQGPQGPAGSPAAILVDYKSLVPAVPHQPNQDVQTFASDKTFTATANGKCIVSISGFVADDATPFVEMFISYKDNNLTYTLLEARAELNGTPIMQGSSVTGVDIYAGRTYEFGVDLKTYESGIAANATAKAIITWNCHYL
jgi:hypothetical protein